jgi:hypothetical protein
MKRVSLLRLETSDQGTFGKLVLPEFTLFTGELPWRDNKNNLSCIPVGLYEVRLTYSPIFKRKLYLVDPVEKRYGIRIHPANFMGAPPKLKCQLNGCISSVKKLDGWMVRRPFWFQLLPSVVLWKLWTMDLSN